MKDLLQNCRIGAIAAGHPLTAAAAAEMLADGGNAFDAALAALCASFSTEPVLASPGGGGFLLAAPVDCAPVIYDFFCQTPGQCITSEELEFFPIHADFGSAEQEFHIGRGAVAVPGVVAGVFAIHKDLCRLPISRLFEPGIRFAEQGVELNAFQAHIFDIVAPIFRATLSARKHYRNTAGDDRLPLEGELFRQPGLARTLRQLANDGPDLFYRGDIARQITGFCRHEGLIGENDLRTYQVIKRHPLSTRYRDVELFTNPLPSSGGTLISFGLELLRRSNHGANYFEQLADVMAQTEVARLQAGAELDQIDLLEPKRLAEFADAMRTGAQVSRGTTQISVVDTLGNEASLTVSNGEGCGEMLGDTGFMLNNMLGEQDLNPTGFHRWSPNRRMTSMMAPSLLIFDDGRRIALGSGGSNRIRTAVLQVILNLVDRRMSVSNAVNAPRIHLENGRLEIEPGFDDRVIERLTERWPSHRLWQHQSLFFGGVHVVENHAGRLSGAGDPRRGGVTLV